MDFLKTPILVYARYYAPKNQDNKRLCKRMVFIFAIVITTGSKKIFMDALDDRLVVIEQWWRGTFKSILLCFAPFVPFVTVMPYQSCENIQMVF